MPALDGLRVLDMTQYEAGTSCTQALAWHGADVVKIEQPGVGDPGRGVGSGDAIDSHYFINWNANKRSVTINLRDERGKALLFEMLPHYDVFVENYGPGVMEKLGLTYEALKEVHPSIIYARLKGFGLSGPFANFKSFDPVAQNAAGAFSVTGEAGGPPMRPGACVGDSGTGMQLAFAITSAYVQKLRTGEGQHIEISMQEAMTYYVRTPVAGTQSWGDVAAERRGNGWNGPTDLYPCKPLPDSDGADDYLYIIALTTRMWDTFCAAMDRPDMVVDPRFCRRAGADRPQRRVEGGDSRLDAAARQVGGDADSGRGGRALLGDAQHLRPVPQPAFRGARVHPGHRASGVGADSSAGLGAEDVEERGADVGRAAAGRAHPRGAPGRPRHRGRGVRAVGG